MIKEQILADSRFRDLTALTSPVFLASPTIHGDERKWVEKAFDTNWVTTAGENINQVEQEICDLLGVEYAVGLSAGTAALHLAIKLAGERLYGQARPDNGTLAGRKVFCSDVTFAATMNPVAYEDGEAVFIDTELETWIMDPIALSRDF